MYFYLFEPTCVGHFYKLDDQMFIHRFSHKYKPRDGYNVEIKITDQEQESLVISNILGMH